MIDYTHTNAVQFFLNNALPMLVYAVIFYGGVYGIGFFFTIGKLRATKLAYTTLYNETHKDTGP